VVGQMREATQTMEETEETMEAGSTVKVYEDPIICKVLEGEAELIHCERVDTETEGWAVVFVEDRGTGPLYRTINKKIN